GKHKYRYTSSDSQLLMDFKNKEIVLETWDINYLENPFYFFENLNHFSIPKNTSITLIKKQDNHIIIDSVCWMIPNENGELEESSGFNAFDGSTKLGIEERKLKINQIQTKYRNKISTKELDFILDQLQLILLKDWKGKVKIKERKELRTNLITFVQQTKNTQLLNEIEGMLSRSSTEMYIPIPESKTFHNKNPNFFGKNIGTFKSDGKTLALSREKRLFKLEFIPSGNIIVAYINQQSGKAIQSINNQDILGKWILWEVFQLKERELLTSQKLNDIGINGIRLIKFKDSNKGIGLEFIWIDEENPPKDAIGWVAKNKKKSA
uniref:hypothetical protein n=1 Tax=Acinetobacter bereziniae TaxID=106648 RepID=UPI001C07D4AC